MGPGKQFSTGKLKHPACAQIRRSLPLQLECFDGRSKHNHDGRTISSAAPSNLDSTKLEDAMFRGCLWSPTENFSVG